MTLLQAHRILIGVASAFFALYAVWEFSGTGGRSGVWRGAAALLAACGLGIYLRTIGGRPAPPPGGCKGGEP